MLWIGSGEERIHPVQRLRIIAYPVSPPTRLTFIPLGPTFGLHAQPNPCPRIRTSKPRSVPRPHPRSSFRISHCFRVLLCAPLSHIAAPAVSPVGPWGLPSALPVSVDPSPMSQPVPVQYVVSRLWLTCFGITQSLTVIRNHFALTLLCPLSREAAEAPTTLACPSLPALGPHPVCSRWEVRSHRPSRPATLHLEAQLGLASTETTE